MMDESLDIGVLHIVAVIHNGSHCLPHFEVHEFVGRKIYRLASHSGQTHGRSAGSHRHLFNLCRAHTAGQRVLGVDNHILQLSEKRKRKECAEQDGGKDGPMSGILHGPYGGCTIFHGYKNTNYFMSVAIFCVNSGKTTIMAY